MTFRQGVFPAICALLTGGCAEHDVLRPRIEELTYPRELEVIRREDWGWKTLTDSIPYHVVNRITIHHGGEDFPPDRDPIEYLQTLQQWSRTEKRWMDTPYHFMIDLQGKIYETRPINYPGDTNTGYNPAGHALVCVMGNYENQILSPHQLDRLVLLTSYLIQRFRVAIDSVRGHKDYTETLCPGKDLYRYLQDGTIRGRAAELIESNNMSH